MYWVIGIITLLGILTGIYALIKGTIIPGILRLLLVAACPIIAVLFASLQDERCFGGTVWAFFVQSATIDGDIWPWILLILLIAEVILIAKDILKLRKHSAEN